MKLVSLRTSPGKESTLGQFYIDGQAECFTLEDQFQTKKVRGETRVPEGIYEVVLRTEVTPMTQRYRKKYPWFTYHLWIKDVPKFEYVYIHAGNTDDHTDGCLLLGDSLINNQVQVGNVKDGFLGNSGQAFERVYKAIHNVIKNTDEKVTIEIRTYKP